ncbi:MAG: T9SS type A sorting domain-containing protein [Sphingobacteriaceae bacterium]|nr:T9SS type A sorting domain-containing protein [Sphingobacteriaceae bacterium]
MQRLSATGATSYNWNPGSLSGTSVVVSPTINTTYTVVGSNAAGCSNTRTVSVTVSACTGITETQSTNGAINIYPNPNNGEFNLVVPEQGVYTIINSIGQTVETIEVKENVQTISIQGLADGIYYVIGKSAKAKIVVSK